MLGRPVSALAREPRQNGRPGPSGPGSGDETIALAGLRLDEVGGPGLARHWRRGGFPRSYLARTEADSVRWRRAFIQTFLEH